MEPRKRKLGNVEAPARNTPDKDSTETKINTPTPTKERPEMKNTPTNFENFSDEELARAIELMIAPEDLMHRDVMTAILKAMDYTPSEVAEQLASGEKLDDGKPVVWKF